MLTAEQQSHRLNSSANTRDSSDFTLFFLTNVLNHVYHLFMGISGNYALFSLIKLSRLSVGAFLQLQSMSVKHWHYLC